MIDYELVLLVSPQIADDQVATVTDKVSQMIKSRGGTVATVKPWGRRRLAYHIKDFQEATYVEIDFSAGGKDATVLTQQLRITEEIIRFMLIKVEAKAPVKEEATA